jgi:hypothetical protein
VGARRERYLCEYPGRTGELAPLGLWFRRGWSVVSGRGGGGGGGSSGGGPRQSAPALPQRAFLVITLLTPVPKANKPHLLTPSSSHTVPRPPHFKRLQTTCPPSCLPACHITAGSSSALVPPRLLIRQTPPDYGRSELCNSSPAAQKPLCQRPHHWCLPVFLLQKSPNYQRSRRCMRMRIP